MPHCYYGLLQGVHCRQLNDQYLAFSSLSLETLVLHPVAFLVLTILSTQPLSHKALLRAITEQQSEIDAGEIANFVQTTLDNFIKLGFINYIDASPQ